MVLIIALHESLSQFFSLVKWDLTTLKETWSKIKLDVRRSKGEKNKPNWMI